KPAALAAWIASGNGRSAQRKPRLAENCVMLPTPHQILPRGANLFLGQHIGVDAAHHNGKARGVLNSVFLLSFVGRAK
ncbi:MAG: hypothetical protein HOJ51_15515, partial [Tateyamaria sp.]|nr:hypothetical protein [Tateyamaria sp.]